MQSDGLSPGESTSAADLVALDLHSQTQRLGWEKLQALRPLRLSRWDAEMLLVRLDYLQMTERAQQAERLAAQMPPLA